jgi:hypothetical protein
MCVEKPDAFFGCVVGSSRSSRNRKYCVVSAEVFMKWAYFFIEPYEQNWEGCCILLRSHAQST